MSKDFLDRVKVNQDPKYQVPVAEVRVAVMPDGQVLVTRPEGDTPGNLAKVVELLSTGIIIISRIIAQAEPSRIVAAPPGLKVQ